MYHGLLYGLMFIYQKVIKFTNLLHGLPCLLTITYYGYNTVYYGYNTGYYGLVHIHIYLLWWKPGEMYTTVYYNLLWIY